MEMVAALCRKLAMRRNFTTTNPRSSGYTNSSLNCEVYAVKRAFSIIYGLLFTFCVLIMGAVGYFTYVLPEQVSVGQGQIFSVGALVQSRPLSAVGKAQAASVPAGERYRARLTLAGLFPLKEVTVSVTEERTVMVCGTPFGIKLYTDGVLVVGLSDVSTAAGRVNPAAAAGIQMGDVIVAINGEEVTSSRQVSRIIKDCDGARLTLRLRRDEVEFDAAFTPVHPTGESGYRAGLWIRDSAAGVGTMTFYDPATGAFGGLGHAVSDVDTGEELPLSTGEVVPARIFGIVKGTAGTPGELKGCFDPGTLGRLRKNSENGVYGMLTVYPMGAVSLPVAQRRQVQEGAAQVLTTLDGTRPRYYDVMIEQVRYSGIHATRNMVVRVTDPDLLALTGGIVQGMSGSPIIQNGRLVGAVTHVLVDDPTRGYGIFAENMLETAQSLSEQQLKTAS